MEYKTVYLPMPIEKAKVRELNAKGYRVVSDEFAPEGYELPDELKQKQRKPRAQATENEGEE